MSNDPQNENFDDNQFEEYRDQYGEDEGGNEVKPSGNRPFIIAIAVIGGLFLLAVAGLVVFYLMNAGRSNATVQEETAKINAQNTAVALQATDIYQEQVVK
jgi:flagellar basal body-associated protein FliL